VYVSIGNSDDKLSQAEWSEFVTETAARVASCATRIHGFWLSLPHGRWQNACWCLEFTTPGQMDEPREVAAELAAKYRQDSIAWAEISRTEFIPGAS
jgi:hypothetical protein